MKYLPHALMIDSDRWTGANCLSKSADPIQWDVDSFMPLNGRTRHHRRAEAVALCNGCPVVRDCAIAAAEENLPGTVRAGILLTITHGSMDSEARAAIHAIAEGMDPARVWSKYRAAR